VEMSKAWERRNWARASLTALGCTSCIIVTGLVGTPSGYFLFGLVAIVCVVGLVAARRRVSRLSSAPRAEWVASSQSDYADLRVASWSAYVPALAVVSRVIRHPFRLGHGVAIVGFIGFGMFVQLALVRRGASGEETDRRR
jgi:hypothetical protein